MPLLLIPFAAAVWLSAACGVAAPRVIDLDPDLELRDLGVDPATGVVRAIGMVPGPGTSFDSPTLITVDGLSVQTDPLVGLGPDTLVLGVSSDGSRIAGVSKSPGSVSEGEGATWLSNQPNDPIGIGFVPGFDRTSLAAAAWRDGVVGDHDGLQDAVSWTAAGGLVVLDDGGGLSQALDVTEGGSVAVGSASSIVTGGGPAYWDSTGFHAFPTPIGEQGQANAVSPDGGYAGGEIAFAEFDPLDFGVQAAIWTRVDDAYGLALFTNADGGRFKGEVEDVSNSGYAVGRANTVNENDEFLPTGFVWRPGWEAPLDLYAWLNATADGAFTGSAPPVVAIGETPDALWFALESPARLIRIDRPAAPGDYNRDGAVDHLDYDLWASTYGQTVPIATAADGNANGRIDAADYTVWRDGLPSPALSVPEPNALVGALLASLMAPLAAPRRSPRTDGRRSSR